MVNETSLSFRQCLQHLWVFLKPNRRKLWTGLLMVIVMQVTYALLPSVEGMITSQLQLDLQAMQANVPGAHIQMDRIVQILLMLGSVYLVKISSQFISAFTLTDSIQKTMFDIRNAVEHKINLLPVSYIDKQKTGDLLSRITNDVETVSNALQQTLSRIIGAVCTFAFSLAMMLSIDWKMTCIVLLALPLIAFISIFIVRKTQPLFDEQQAALAQLNSTVNELYSGYSEILAYSQQKKARQIFQQSNLRMKKAGFYAQLASGCIGPLTSLITYLTIAICALTGCLQVLAGTLLLGQLQAFIRYIWSINDPVSQLSQLSSQVQSAFSGMNRLFTFLSLPQEQSESAAALSGPVETIEFSHCVFGYNDEILMKDISFTIKKGQRVAIVGPTGAGKTTLTNLLLRFYPLKGGEIKINGININTLSFGQLRSLFGLVLQDTWLFEGSILENLRYGRKDAPKEDVERAAKLAKIHHTIQTLPEGYEAAINEAASNFSQGEKQLLTIARAFLKDPEILILDEATSSVDTRLEKRLQSAMDEIMKDRTSLVIAHRLSTIVNADLILVMNHGDIIESGTHQQLLEKNGMYAKLYNSQFQDMDEDLPL